MKGVTLVGKGPAGGAKGGFVGFVGGGGKERQGMTVVSARRARAQDSILQIRSEWYLCTHSRRDTVGLVSGSLEAFVYFLVLFRVV